MLLSEAQLRAAIRNIILKERNIVATASDIAKQTDLIEEWVDLLLDELSNNLPNGRKMMDWADKKRNNHIKKMAKNIRLYLISALGYQVSPETEARSKLEKDKAAHKRYKASLKQYGGDYLP